MINVAVHLSIRSHYSLLNGIMDIKEIIQTAKEMGYTAVTLSEHRVMFSALEFAIEAKKHGIKPIFGLEVKIDTYYSMIIAKDTEGMKVLYRLSYLLSQDEAIMIDDFKDSIDHLVFIVYSEAGPFDEGIIASNFDLVTSKLLELKAQLKTFYIGISHQESKFFQKSNQKLIEIAMMNGIECVALPKVYYKRADDQYLLRALHAISKQTHLDDQTLNSEPGRFFYTPHDFEIYYERQLIENTEAIARMCHVDLFENKTDLIEFENEHNVSNDIYIKELTEFGLRRRLNNKVSNLYIQRLEYELDVLSRMGFVNYFLVVYDIIRFAKKEGIYVGPGRGSAAGSLVAYCLGITDVDPLKYGLLFERFLNPERISMPDIDIDFPDDRRDEVIAYAIDKYGSDHVAHIISFGTLRAKQSFRDSARILQIPLHKVNQVSKLLSNKSLAESYRTNKRLQVLIKSDTALKECYELAASLEGKPRHVTMHPAGIVMSQDTLLNVAPVYALDHEHHAIQYEMTHLESLGFIKIDFLGLRNLTLIDRIVHQIPNPEFDIRRIPLDDKRTFDLIGRGETIGIFQLESEGMKNLLVRMNPTSFMDIVDTIALYRPGPMENIPIYLQNRKNPHKIEYAHADLKELTKDTYGVLVYQEQIMQTAQYFAGFSLGKADILRRAMSKKDERLLDSLRQDFLDGSIEKGYDPKLAQDIFDLIYKFANYGFNKSHSVAYGLIAYQLAYLKANYPALFYTELMNSVIGDDQKTRLYIEECRRMNVLLMPINLDQSEDVYILDGHKIRLPLNLIKGISKQVVRAIMQDRKDQGAYNSYYQAIIRLHGIGISSKNIESLIYAGAFDYFGHNRSSMLASLDEAIRYASLISIKDSTGKVSFDTTLVSEPLFTQTSESVKDMLAREVSVLGFYFSEHPTLHLKTKHKTDSLIDCEPGSKDSYRVIAMIDRIKTHRAKNGKMMAFLEISDDSGRMDAVVFSNVYEKVSDLMHVGDIVLLKASMKNKGSLIVNDLVIFKE